VTLRQLGDVDQALDAVLDADEVAEQVAKVGDEVFVKVIDIDLERRRISLSLKQANEGVGGRGPRGRPRRGRRRRREPAW